METQHSNIQLDVFGRRESAFLFHLNLLRSNISLKCQILQDDLYIIQRSRLLQDQQAIPPETPAAASHNEMND